LSKLLISIFIFTEHNPDNTILPVPTSRGVVDQLPFQFEGGRDRDRGDRGGRKRTSRRDGKKNGTRAAFSAEGAVHDRSKSTIVVENIPEEHFSEEQVRDYFSQFGTIVEVSMRPYKHLAILKYERWSEANAAYQSPKAIFDNRFVKVFWLKEGVDTTAPSAAGSGQSYGNGHGGLSRAGSESKTQEPEVDLEEFRRKQDEAQRQYQEREAKRIAIEQQRLALEKKQQDLLAKHREESQRLQEKLAEKNSDEPTVASTGTDMLRAKLAALEQEAKILGIDPDAELDEGGNASPYSPGPGGFHRGGGRGGAGGVRGRGRGWGGRGSFRGNGGRHAAYAQFSIDNRPKRVAITGVDFTVPEKDESLRHFLLVSGLRLIPSSPSYH
jgi:RNA-binding protein 26